MFKSGTFNKIWTQITPFFYLLTLIMCESVGKLTISKLRKQHKEGTCKVSGRSVIFSSFYVDFCLCRKSVIITTLTDSQFID